ncbi:MAG: response regulator [Clostridiales bacterium]
MERILLIDDSPIIHSLMKKALEKNGYKICGNARNGKEGVTLYVKLKPDIVFMDVTMPIMDGIEATKKIIEFDPKAVVIMLTAMGDNEIIKNAEEAGVKIFLKKPFNEYKIISSISKVI